MLGSLLLLVFFLFFFIRNNIKGIAVVIIISLLNDMFIFSLGFSLPMHYLISLIYLPKVIFEYKLIPFKAKKLLAPIYVELLYLIILAVFFGFIFPWKSEFDYQRTWSQKAEGRAIIQVIKLISEISLVLLLVLWLNTKRLTVSYLLKVTAIVIISSVIFAFVDPFLGLKNILFSELRDVEGRFTALNVEPRTFGRICSFVLLLLLPFKNLLKNKIIKIGIIFSSIGIVISLSASTYLMTLVWLIVYIIIMKKFKLFLIGIPLLFGILFFLNQNQFFREQTLKKIEIASAQNNGFAAKEKVNEQEPDFFASFEVFDRAALNFLYNEPMYFITGTGPNLISIPSSPYLTASTYTIYENRIDSVPHTFIVNLISRSGLIGLFIWIVFFVKFKNSSKGINKEQQALFICTMIAYFIVATSFFLFIIAILTYNISINSKKKLND